MGWGFCALLRVRPHIAPQYGGMRRYRRSRRLRLRLPQTCRSMCGCAFSSRPAPAAARSIIRAKPAFVNGVPHSLTKTKADGALSRYRGPPTHGPIKHAASMCSILKGRTGTPRLARICGTAGSSTEQFHRRITTGSIRILVSIEPPIFRWESAMEFARWRSELVCRGTGRMRSTIQYRLARGNFILGPTAARADLFRQN